MGGVICPPPVYVYFDLGVPRRPIAHTTAIITSVAPTPAPNRIALSMTPPPLAEIDRSLSIPSQYRVP